MAITLRRQEPLPDDIKAAVRKGFLTARVGARLPRPYEHDYYYFKYINFMFVEFRGVFALAK